jgi:hypothetical protein
MRRLPTPLLQTALSLIKRKQKPPHSLSHCQSQPQSQSIPSIMLEVKTQSGDGRRRRRGRRGGGRHKRTVTAKAMSEPAQLQLTNVDEKTQQLEQDFRQLNAPLASQKKIKTADGSTGLRAVSPATTTTAAIVQTHNPCWTTCQPL